VQRWRESARLSSVNLTMAGMSGEAERPGSGTGIARQDRGDAVAAVTDLFREHRLELVRLALMMVGDLAT